MKVKYFALGLLLISIFGLISCSSDKAAAPLEGAPVGLDPVILNSDGTFRKLGDTNLTSVTSLLDLQMSDESVENMKALTHTTCKTNFLNEPVTFNQEFHKKAQIPILQALPTEVFTPVRDREAQVLCQFDIKIYVQDQYVGEIVFNDLDIQDTQSYSNLHPEFFDLDENLYFFYDQLVEQNTSLPEGSHEVQTLCQQSNKFSFTDNSSLPNTELFPITLFNQQNNIYCRLLFTSKESIWLTPSFSVQQTRHQLTVDSLERFITVEKEVDLRNKVLARIKVHNPSAFDTYFSFSELTTNIIHIPIYSIYRTGEHSMVAPRYRTSGRWTVRGASLIEGETGGEEGLYHIPAYGSAEIQLVSLNEKLQCNITARAFPAAPINHPSGCRQFLLLSGAFYDIHDYPQIKINESSQMDSPHWRIEDPTPQNLDRPYSFWVPLTEMPLGCTNEEPIEQIVGALEPLVHNDPAWFICDPQ